MCKVLDLKNLENPLEAIEFEQGQPEAKPDWLFTSEEGYQVSQIIKESGDMFRGLLGKGESEITPQIALAVLLVQKKVQAVLDRTDFAFVPVYREYFDHQRGQFRRGFRIDWVRL